MTLYKVAFRPEVSTQVVTDFLDHYADERCIFSGKYGLTVLAEIHVQEVLDEFDWAFSMVCNMELKEGE